jgi:hypothetical protein
MKIRCLECNNAIEFSQRQGKKLTEFRCEKNNCGGKFEKLSMHQRDGISPLGPEFTYFSPNDPNHIGDYWIYVSPSGEYMMDDKNNVFIKLEKLDV